MLLAAAPVAVHFEVDDTGPSELSSLAADSIIKHLETLGSGRLIVDADRGPCERRCRQWLASSPPKQAFVVSIVAGLRRVRAEIVRADEPARVWGVVEEVPGSERWDAALRGLLGPLVAELPGTAAAIAQPSLGAAERPVLPWVLAGVGVSCSVASIIFAARYSADGEVVNREPIYDAQVRAADGRRQAAGPVAVMLLGAAVSAFAAALYLGEN